jgi:hypothetical protein
MHVTVLGVPGCPHLPLLEKRLAQVLDSLPGVAVSCQVIATEDEAARSGMHGSPTILIDGIDPFAEPGQPASVSCRLYRDSDGRTDGAPSVRQLRDALTIAAASGGHAASLGWLVAPGRAGRGRIAPAEQGLRAVHQAILRAFASTGHAPEPESLEEAAAPFSATAALAELAAGDFLCLDQAGRISAAYPFLGHRDSAQGSDRWWLQRVCHVRRRRARDRADAGHERPHPLCGPRHRRADCRNCRWQRLRLATSHGGNLRRAYGR